MPIAKGPRGSIFQANISVEPCDEGFRATVSRVIQMKPPNPVGIEVEHNIPSFSAGTTEKAERLVEISFKAWAKSHTLVP